jgi:transposase
MIALPSGVQVWLAAGVTDLRKGFDGLSALVQLQLAEDPFVCAGIRYVLAHHEQPGFVE